MDKFILALILALMPIVSYYSQYLVARKNKRLNAFRKFLPVQYMDWIFIPFNFLLLYTVNINLFFNLYLGVATIIGALLLLVWWGKEDPNNSDWEDYSFRNGRFRAEGWVHGIYALFQGFLVIVFIFSKTHGVLALIECLLLLVYFIIGIIGIHKLRKRFSPPDLFYIIVGIVVTLLKLFLTIFL